jgi:hypothetical protein
MGALKAYSPLLFGHTQSRRGCCTVQLAVAEWRSHCCWRCVACKERNADPSDAPVPAKRQAAQLIELKSRMSFCMQVPTGFKFITSQMDVPSLIREVCRRKGSCEILDLGSGVPDYYQTITVEVHTALSDTQQRPVKQDYKSG